jgi:beta-glucosidase/6-phospho-beta-glucosidase/beta-galactosidase
MQKFCVIPNYMTFLLFIFALFASESAQADLEFPDSFLFGLATAPAHVEDGIVDAWTDFADQGKVAAVQPELEPKRRLEFWSHPKVEIDLAAETGVKIFRLGVDWQRLVPAQPGSFNCEGVCPATIQDKEALAHYKEIITYIKSKNMKVMLTLFHHSPPRWFASEGGWKNPATADYFYEFSMDVMKEFQGYVDYWITLNEPTIYGVMTYMAGTWPYGHKGGIWSFINLGFYKGNYAAAMANMIDAHQRIYRDAHIKYSKIQISIAHHFSYLLNAKGEKSLLAKLIDRGMWSFTDAIKDQMDFVGMNYYGAEYLKFTVSQILDDKEYSDAGRAIYSEGFYILLKQIWVRYKKPVFITENGIGDGTDILRPSYLLEHLAALHQAMEEHVPVLGYIFWTISDNWEWADGYCPKFGLVAVNRKVNLMRTPRPSYFLFKTVVNSKTVTDQQRSDAWRLVQNSVGRERPFCRNRNGFDGLNVPVMRAVKAADWRFKTPKRLISPVGG